MKKKQTTTKPPQDFTITLVTKDGDLLMKRTTDASLFFLPNGQPDHIFIKHNLGHDTRPKGVKLVNYTIDRQGINCIVKYC